MGGIFRACANTTPADAEAAWALPDIAPGWSPRQPPPFDAYPGLDWTDALVLRLARREAEALILPDPIFPADPFAR